MKKVYFLPRLTILIPLLIMILAAGSGIVFIYNLPLQDPTRIVSMMRVYLVWLTFFSFLVGLALSYAILVPLKRLMKLSKDLKKHDYTSNIATSHFEKEIKDLFYSFEEAKHSIDLERKREHLQRLSSLGLLASGVAHEIRNPLSSIKGLVSLINEDFSDEKSSANITDYKKYIQTVLKEVDRMEGVVNNFLSLASGKKSDIKQEVIEIEPFLDEVLSLAAFEFSKKKIKIAREGNGSKERIFGFEERLKQAFLNFIINAYQAMPDGGTLTIAIKRIKSDSLKIIFSDTGSGIDKDKLDMIFDPFFTTKDNGIGLGLAISHQIILAHQGDVEVDSVKGKGTKFTITLPRIKNESQR